MGNCLSSPKRKLNVILLLGLPCSGKSFVAMRILQVFSLFRYVSRDELRNNNQGISIPIETYLDAVWEELKNSSNEEDQVVLLDFNLKGSDVSKDELMSVLSALSEHYEVSVSIIETQSGDLGDSVKRAVNRSQQILSGEMVINKFATSLHSIKPEQVSNIIENWEVMTEETLNEVFRKFKLLFRFHTLPPPDGSDWSRRNKAVKELLEQFQH